MIPSTNDELGGYNYSTGNNSNNKDSGGFFTDLDQNYDPQGGTRFRVRKRTDYTTTTIRYVCYICVYSIPVLIYTNCIPTAYILIPILIPCILHTSYI